MSAAAKVDQYHANLIFGIWHFSGVIFLTLINATLIFVESIFMKWYFSPWYQCHRSCTHDIWQFKREASSYQLNIILMWREIAITSTSRLNTGPEVAGCRHVIIPFSIWSFSFSHAHSIFNTSLTLDQKLPYAGMWSLHFHFVAQVFSLVYFLLVLMVWTSDQRLPGAGMW